MNRLAFAAFALFWCAVAQADALDDIMKMQKDGMWEMRVPGQAKPLLFCVTGTTRIGGLQETRDALKSLGCKTDKAVLAGDQYEVVLNCTNKDPNIGNFRMVMKGTARADVQTGTTTITGGGQMIKGMFPSGKEGGGQNRWLRPCKPGEKPGLQGAGQP